VESAKENIKSAWMGNCELQYSDEGEGVPILLVHGGVFADWFLPLAVSGTLRDFRVIPVRRAGYNPSLLGPSVSIREHARHLADLLGLLKLSSVHVAGHSSGALIALQLAADNPAMVDALALIEPAPLGSFQVPAFEALVEKFVGPSNSSSDLRWAPMRLEISAPLITTSCWALARADTMRFSNEV
jgi:pimeloyl-ACP methyl ester carboxylesterase